MSKYFDKVTFGKRLLEAMEDNNDTTYSLGEHLHLSAATISRYTTGEMAPKIPTIQAIAEKYGLNPGWLMGTEGEEKYIEKLPSPKQVPIIDYINTDQSIFSPSNIIGYEYVQPNSDIDFCILVKGNYMANALIFNGSTVYVKKQTDLENGCIFVLVINNSIELRKVSIINDSVLFRAENLDNPDERIVHKKDLKKVIVLGKVIKVCSEVK